MTQSKRRIVNSLPRVMGMLSGVVLVASLVVAQLVLTPKVSALVSPTSITLEEGGDGVDITVTPELRAANYNKYRRTLYVIPNNGVNLGFGDHVPVQLDISVENGQWRLTRFTGSGSHLFYHESQLGGFTLHVTIEDDNADWADTYENYIQIGYPCYVDFSGYPKQTLQSWITITVKDNDGEEGGGMPQTWGPHVAWTPCLLEDWDWSTQEATEVATNTATRNNQAATSSASHEPEKEPEASVPFLLNESEAYMNGGGETVWLKVGEKVRFNLQNGDNIDEHLVTVKEHGDDYATILIHSDLIELTVKKDETKEIDVDRDGANDISVKLVDIADGQAGLLFKPISDKAKVAGPVTIWVTKVNKIDWGRWAGIAGIAFLMAAVVLLILARRGVIRLPSMVTKSRFGKIIWQQSGKRAVGRAKSK